jgi:hypothetical protein
MDAPTSLSGAGNGSRSASRACGRRLAGWCSSTRRRSPPKTRLRGRSPCGERLKAAAPFGRWGTQTFIAGLRCSGLIAPFVVQGAMDRAAFNVWVEQELAPALQPGDVVILDNLSVHKSARAAQALAARGAWFLFLPQCSPTSIRSRWRSPAQGPSTQGGSPTFRRYGRPQRPRAMFEPQGAGITSRPPDMRTIKARCSSATAVSARQAPDCVQPASAHGDAGSAGEIENAAAVGERADAAGGRCWRCGNGGRARSLAAGGAPGR